MTIYRGKVHVFGDNIDTDRIIAGKYTKTLDVGGLAQHLLEDIDPDFSKKVRRGEILVAGSNFGAGSSREQAPLAIQAAGLTAVVASSFARIFFRNAVNIGLPVVEIGYHQIETGSEIEINLESGWVNDLTANQGYKATKMPQVMMTILESGGLVNYLRERGGYLLPN